METNYFIGSSDKLFEILKWITPVLLFGLAYFINELIASKKRKRKLKVLKSLLLTQLLELYQHIIDQIKHNSDCITRLETFDTNDVRLARHSGSNIERIRQIPFEDIFQILVNAPAGKKKIRDYYIERFSKLFRIIDYYDTSIRTAYQDNDLTIRNLNETLEKWNKSHFQTINFKNMLTTLIKINNLQLSADTFVDGFSTIIHEFGEQHGNNVQNLDLAFSEFVLPLIEHSKKHSDDPRSAYLMGLLQESKHAYLETKSIRLYAAEGLKKLNESLSKFNPAFEKIITEIKNKN